MYVTKPLSLLRRSPELLNLAPTEGPNSGYLVLFDEECERRTCFGLSKETSIKALPFPQNKDLTVTHTTSNGNNNRSQTSRDEVAFIPVLDQPLSSNRYYVISRKGKHKGYLSNSPFFSPIKIQAQQICFLFWGAVKPSLAQQKVTWEHAVAAHT